MVEERDHVRTFREILGDPQATPAVFGYRDPLRFMPLVLVPLLLVAFGVLVVQTIVRDGPIVAPLVAAAVLALPGYLWSFRIGSSVECRDGIIEWRAPLASRRVPVSAVLGSRGERHPALLVEGQRRLTVSALGQGWDMFLLTLQRLAPDGNFPERSVGAWVLPWGDGYYQE